MSNIFENGDRLPAAAKVVAISSYTQFLDKYPVVQKVSSERWDFTITIAGVFVAVSQLNHENISDDDKEALRDRISVAAVEIYPDFVEACEDCRIFVDRTYEGLAVAEEYRNNKQFLFSDAIGSWIVLNLLDHAPSNEDEAGIIRSIGIFVVNSFFYWWKKSDQD